jgi:hypothetical protein
MTDKHNQSEQILAYMMRGYTITPLEALSQFGCFRLGARCYDLKHRGINIKSEMVHDVKTGKHYKKYWVDGLQAQGA